MSATLVNAAAWSAVLAMTVSAILFGQGARVPARPARDARVAHNPRIGTALSISGPIAVVLLAVAAATMTQEWLLVAVIAFAAVGVVAVVGLLLAPH
ncbi:MAG: hypothetical protein H0T54_09855 [Geodermatophilaceae bacterium]|nr:hypothetical protein [Geodermatophilaceae bacterium]